MTDFAKLREATEKATPGPRRCSRPDMLSYDASDGVQNSFIYRSPEERICIRGDNCIEDAAFIATARNEVPFLLFSLDEARAEAARLREALRHSLEWIDGWDCVFKDDPEWKEARYYIDKALEVKP